MARLRISRLAQADLASVLRTSLEHWGESGRARYAALLATAMQRTAEDPHGPTTSARADLGSGVRSFPIRHARRGTGVKAPVHVLFYRVTDAGAVEIIRVLHERMEPRRHRFAPARTIRTRRRR